MEKLFLAKIKDSDDRDCVFYVELRGFECNHYFGGLSLCGACFAGYEKEFRDRVDNNFDSLETILTKEEMEQLFALNDELKALGYGIEKDSEKYNKGIELMNQMELIISDLRSAYNEDLWCDVIEEEKEYCMNEYNLSKEEVDDIFEDYKDVYQDRSIICCVYENNDDLFDSLKMDGYIECNDNLRDYVDVESYINDLIDSDNWYKTLDDGRIVYYSY